MDFSDTGILSNQIYLFQTSICSKIQDFLVNLNKEIDHPDNSVQSSDDDSEEEKKTNTSVSVGSYSNKNINKKKNSQVFTPNLWLFKYIPLILQKAQKYFEGVKTKLNHQNV